MAVPDIHKWRYIFHFTDIHNLDSIIKNGLLCQNEKTMRGIKHKNIANMTIQTRRAKLEVPVKPRGMVHDYVPFYFSSINPMLLTLLNQKNVDQCYIVYLCVRIERLENDDAVFTDASANRDEAPNFYTDTEQLIQLDWTLIDSKKWRMPSDDDKHKKMAEAFIYQKVELSDIDCIVVWNECVKQKVIDIFKENGIEAPDVVYNGNKKLSEYSFYYTKFFIPGQERNTLVTGPLELYNKYQYLLKSIVEERKKKKLFTYQKIEDLLIVIDDKFTALPELKELTDLQQDYIPHNDTVEEHTKKVIAEIKKQAYYYQAAEEKKAVLVLSAYLHDIGKGPKDKWGDDVMKYAYLDHPADAIPMLYRILTEEIATLSEEDIRQICMLVVYHDIIGDCMLRGREKEQIAVIIINEEDFEMLFAISIADAKAIKPEWAENIMLGKDKLCHEVFEVKDKFLWQ